MKYLSADQLPLYLKLGRGLDQFISVGRYFEDVTFDWVRLSGSIDKSKIELIRSFDEGDEYCCDVTSFSTVAENDVEEIKEFSGDFDRCLLWLETELGGSRDKFLEKGMIDREYEKYVQRKSKES